MTNYWNKPDVQGVPLKWDSLLNEAAQLGKLEAHPDNKVLKMFQRVLPCVAKITQKIVLGKSTNDRFGPHRRWLYKHYYPYYLILN